MSSESRSTAMIILIAIVAAVITAVVVTFAQILIVGKSIPAITGALVGMVTAATYVVTRNKKPDSA